MPFRKLCHFHEIVPSYVHLIRKIDFCWSFKLNKARIKQLAPYIGLQQLELWTRNDSTETKDPFELSKDGDLILRKPDDRRLMGDLLKMFPRLNVFVKQEMLSAMLPRPVPAQQWLLGKRVEYVPDLGHTRVWKVVKEDGRYTMVLVNDFDLE